MNAIGRTEQGKVGLEYGSGEETSILKSRVRVDLIE